MDAIAEYLGMDRLAVREANLIQPEEMPYDQGLVFQDGRPLIYDSGDYPTMLRMIRELVGWDGFEAERAAAAAEGRRIGIGIAAYVEGTGMGPYEGAHVKVETTGEIVVSTGLTTQGQGHYTSLAQIAADVLGVGVGDVTVITGDTRRFKYAVGTFASRAIVTSGNAVAIAAGKVAGRRRSGSRRRRWAAGSPPTTWNWSRARCGAATTPPSRSTCARSRCCRTRCGTPSTRRPRRPRSSPRPSATGDEPGLEAIGYYMPDALDVRGRGARRRGRDRSGDRRYQDPAVLRRARLRRGGEPAHRRGPGARRRRAGRRGSAVRADRLRRGGAAGERLLHGLPDPVRHARCRTSRRPTWSRRRE